MSKEKIRYISKAKDKAWYISDIFQKAQDGQYFTKDALLYHDILKYSYYKSYFKRSKLDYWLVQNNNEFYNRYKDLSTRNVTYSNRVHANKERIDRIFNNLLNGKLITVSGTVRSAKIRTLNVEVYSINKIGKLIWLIIKAMNSMNEIQQAQGMDVEILQTRTKELNSNNHRLYESIVSMLAKGKDAPYKSTMLRVFFGRLKNRNLFDNFVNHLVEICNLNNRIGDATSLLSYVLDYVINEAYDRSSYIDLWYESASELDTDSKRYFSMNQN